MADIDTLIDRHGEDTVRKAFWLQEHIYEEGIAGIDFTGEAESKMRKIGPMRVKQRIEAQFPDKI